MGYRATPHPATNVTQYEALMYRKVRIMMDTMNYKVQNDNIDENDAEYKAKVKRNKENRNTNEHSFIVGDYVLLKQQKRNKCITAYEPNFYQIFRMDGSIGARRIVDGREIYRVSSRFKLANNINNDDKVKELNSRSSEEIIEETWREDLLKAPVKEVTNGGKGTADATNIEDNTVDATNIEDNTPGVQPITEEKKDHFQEPMVKEKRLKPSPVKRKQPNPKKAKLF